MSDSSNVTLSFREKAGYSLGDAGANFVFQMLVVFQVAFYTDVMGLGAATVGWMLLILRFSDAITDPIMGMIADRTQSRWGKFRPWLIWSAIPLALLFWAAFTVPSDLSESGRLWYSVVTYTLLLVTYTMNNAPYSALNGVMTSNGSERTSLSQFRFFAAMCATFVVQGLTLPLVGKLGSGDDAKGWSLTIGLLAGVAVVFFVVAFFSARERVHPPKGQRPDPKRDCADLLANRPWAAMFAMTLFVFITLALKGGSMYYYFTYYVDSDALTRLADSIGLVSSVANLENSGFNIRALDAFGLILTPGSDPSKVSLSLFNMTSALVAVLGVLSAKPLADRFGKKTVFITGLGSAALLQFLFFFLDATSVPSMFLLAIATSLAYGPTIPLLWAMIADTADYGEWKFYRRSTGFVFAAIVFALKSGLGIGGAITGWLLAFYGYTPDTATEPSVLFGLRAMVGLYSGGFFLLGAACMLCYPIGKTMAAQMRAELETRRVESATDNPS